MPADAMTAGLYLYTALALVAGFLLRRWGLALVALAVAWVPWLLGRDPATARTAVIAVAWVVVARYGWRHLLLWASVGGMFGLFAYQRVTTGGVDFGAAVIDAVNRAVYVAALIALAFWAWQLVRGRSLTNPLAWAAERRKLHATAEHRRAMGWGRRGVGKLVGRARARVTGRELPRPPDKIDQLNQHDLFVLARRHGIKPARHTTDELREQVRQAQRRPPGPPPPTAEAHPRTRRPEDQPPVNPLVDQIASDPTPIFHGREPVFTVWWRR